MMFRVAVGSVEWKDFVIFIDENADADGMVYLLEFWSVAKFKVHTLMLFWMFIYSVYMAKNTP